MDGCEVVLALPRNWNDFHRDNEPEVPPSPCVTVASALVDVGSQPPAVVHIVEVYVEFDFVLSAKDKDRAAADTRDADDGPRYRFDVKTTAAWERGFSVAQHVAHAWVSHVRSMAGQPWLGITAALPQQYGRGHLFDVAAGRGLMAFGDKQTVTWLHAGVAVSATQLDAVHGDVLTGSPPTAEAMLSDARAMAEGDEGVDTQRAVLTAAIACEVKAKKIVKEHATAERLKGLGAISNLDDLVDGFYLKTFGVSLRLANQRLFKLIKRLTARRNLIVHQGIAIESKDCNQLLLGAAQLFVWIESVAVDAARANGGGVEDGKMPKLGSNS
mgnify:CR=1 FL=1